jgi:hypothetical protein
MIEKFIMLGDDRNICQVFVEGRKVKVTQWGKFLCLWVLSAVWRSLYNYYSFCTEIRNTISYQTTEIYSNEIVCITHGTVLTKADCKCNYIFYCHEIKLIWNNSTSIDLSPRRVSLNGSISVKIVVLSIGTEIILKILKKAYYFSTLHNGLSSLWWAMSIESWADSELQNVWPDLTLKPV